MTVGADESRRASVLACSPLSGSQGCTSEDACATASSPSGDFSPNSDDATGGEEHSPEELAASDCPEMLIERERRRRVDDVRGLALFEGRLLSLIAGQGSANPEKVLN